MYPETIKSNVYDLKDTETLAKVRKAGQIASQARDYGASLIKLGVPLKEILDKVEAKIKELGGGLAFPAQINRNDIAAHYCSAHDDEETCQEGDIIKFDCGVHIDGYVGGDTAVTVYLGKDKRIEKLKNASKKALQAAIKAVKPGVTNGELGKIIGDVITGEGFVPIKNLSGHGVGRYCVHTSPGIPNFATGANFKLEPGMVIAIEPFASDGAGMVYEDSEAEVFMMVNKRPVRNPIVRNVLKEIDKFKGLPFAPRWIMEKKGMTPQKVAYALNELQKAEMVRAYPPLIDKNRGLVSQHEHTILVTEDGCEVLTKEL